MTIIDNMKWQICVSSKNFKRLDRSCSFAFFDKQFSCTILHNIF